MLALGDSGANKSTLRSQRFLVLTGGEHRTNGGRAKRSICVVTRAVGSTLAWSENGTESMELNLGR